LIKQSLKKGTSNKRLLFGPQGWFDYTFYDRRKRSDPLLTYILTKDFFENSHYFEFIKLILQQDETQLTSPKNLKLKVVYLG